ncbi:MAG: ribosome biogenesis GTPase Der [Pseudomonadota bacterium]|nr:ribosome biogenesis GTPase Der [Pseudomonadota bacterium]
MLPVIALVGRPNVGKSTLFNRLTRTRDAIVDDQPGVTRDRLYGRGRIGGKPCLVVDTGGLEPSKEHLSRQIWEQVEQVLQEAQAVLFLVDGQEGLAPPDREIAEQLRQSGHSVYLVANKTEGVDSEVALAEFQELGFGHLFAVSAKRGDGAEELMEAVLASFDSETPESKESERPRVALIGRPNAGKSTLINALLGERRVIVSELPGTTRDSVRIPIEVNGEEYLLIDTAGVRRRARVSRGIEKFSVVKTLQAVEEANVVVLVLDAQAEIGAQDATIAGMVNDLGRALVIAVNKWDRLAKAQRQRIRGELELKFPFLGHAEVLFISALYGTGVGDVLPAAKRAYRSAMAEFATSDLNRKLQDAVSANPPPMRHGRRIKLKFAHQAGKNPPVIVIHGSQVSALPESYRRYLANYFIRAYRLVGTPVRIILRSGKNPYQARSGGREKRRRRG